MARALGEPLGMTDEHITFELRSQSPVDLCRHQVLNGNAGRIDPINKSASWSGLLMGRKAFQKPRHEGVALIQAVQDVYLSDEVTIA